VRTQTLVAIDWNGADRDIEPVRHFIRKNGGPDALVDVTPVDFTKDRTGEVVGCWRVTFDADKVRNTEVHGAGYRAGFVSHIE
jgi:hypothetical protein